MHDGTIIWMAVLAAGVLFAALGASPVPAILFAQVAGPRFRAAIRTEEPFLTRVAYLESPPPPQVKLDDAAPFRPQPRVMHELGHIVSYLSDTHKNVGN